MDPSHGATSPIAQKMIPRGFTATHVDIYGANAEDFDVYKGEIDNDTTTFSGHWVFDGDSIITVTESHSNNELIENSYSVIWKQSNTMTVNFPFEVEETFADLEFIFGLKTGTLVSADGSVELVFSTEQSQ